MYSRTTTKQTILVQVYAEKRAKTTDSSRNTFLRLERDKSLDAPQQNCSERGARPPCTRGLVRGHRQVTPSIKGQPDDHEAGRQSMGKISTFIKLDQLGSMFGAQRHAKRPLYAVAFGLGLTIWFVLLRTAGPPPAAPIRASDNATHHTAAAARRTAVSPKTTVTVTGPQDMRSLETPSGESNGRVRPVPDILQDATLIVRAPHVSTGSVHPSKKQARRAANDTIQARPNETTSIPARPHETTSTRAQRSAHSPTSTRAQYDPAAAVHQRPSSSAVTVTPASHPAGSIGQQTVEQICSRRHPCR